MPALWLVLGAGSLLLWATTRPRWQKAHCSWCGARVTASAMKFDEKGGVWITYYQCLKCGHTTEKTKSTKV
ncbi:MAG TPA: hypothetical protein VMV05_06050 [bacterium]|nr:hypothetical protein [bacterium]